MNPVASAGCAVACILLAASSTRGQPDKTAGAAGIPESPRIAALARAIKGGDAAAMDAFWREIEGKAPLIESIAGDATHVRVTFLWRGTDQTRRIMLIGGMPGGDETLDRLEGTDLWYLTERMPAAARFGYMFLVDYPKMVPGSFARNPFPRPDPLNPSRLGFQSLAVLPQAPAQPWIMPRPAGGEGTLTAVAVESRMLKKQPPVWVHTPQDYDPKGQPCALLVAFDGETCGALPKETLIPLPAIVDNLAAAHQIPRTVVVLIGSADHESRTRNLRCSDSFADYVAKELVPWVRATTGWRRTGLKLSSSARAMADWPPPTWL